MCSITDRSADAPARPATLAALVAHHAEIGELIALILRDPRLATAASDGVATAPTVERVDLGALPADTAASLTTTLLSTADRAAAAAAALVGQVTATTGPGTGTLIAGRYASARRWLEVEARLAPHSAKAVLARARDLREHSELVHDAWLAGEVGSDAVRELTCGVSGVLRDLKTSREEKDRLRAQALDLLLPVARTSPPADLTRAVARLRLLAESAHEEQAAIEAYDEQSLTCVDVGHESVITAHLTHENAAAVMTVIDRHARRIADRDPRVVHDPACPLASPAPPAGRTGTTGPRWCSCGAAAAAGVTSKNRWPHLLAVAFAELMTGQLDQGLVGSHHGVAPHVTVNVDLDQLQAGLGGCLTMPGSDEPVLLGSTSVRRILCDADITPVVVRRLLGSDARACTGELATLLTDRAVEVLYVGRAQRTAPPRLRRALEARDRHCIRGRAGGVDVTR